MSKSFLSTSSLEAELSRIGGCVEWATARGIGIGFDDPAAITNEKLREIENALRDAVWINLSDTQVTDDLADALLNSTKLESLDLIDTRITSGGLIRIKSALPSLVEIDFSGELDAPTAKELAKRWPELRIVRPCS